MRKSLLKIRRAMSAAEAEAKSKAIFENLKKQAAYQSARAVLVYADFDGEVQTGRIIADLEQRGVNVYLPLILSDTEFVPCRMTKNVQKNRYGIDEPVPCETAPKASGKIDLAICPGVGFDRLGNRLGYGKGYYDRYLSGETCYKIGLAYEAQIVAALEDGPDDVAMNCVITEKAVYGACG